MFKTALNFFRAALSFLRGVLSFLKAALRKVRCAAVLFLLLSVVNVVALGGLHLLLEFGDVVGDEDVIPLQ